MTEVIESTPAPSEAVDPNVFLENPAVARCMRARIRVFREERAKNKDEYDSNKAAIQAYRNAMPSPSGYENIRDFIACVARGMLIGVINNKDSTMLLYAAQVASGTALRQPAPPLKIKA
jgi:hypothetical protein